MLARQHQLAAILRRGGWTWRMCGRWSPPGGELATVGAVRVPVAPPAPGSLDFNERGTWSSVRVGPLQGEDARAAAGLDAALGVTRLGPDDLSPQGRLRAGALEAAGWSVAGAHLLHGGVAVHLGSGAERGSEPGPLGRDELETARAALPLDLPPPLDQDVALAVLLGRLVRPGG